MEYILIRVETADLPQGDPKGDPIPATMNDLTQKVNEFIKSGWRPQGGVCQYQSSYWTAFFNGETMDDSEVTTEGFLQAMVRD
jgi:hypothetical protein